jgi:hypothetical protein
MTAMAELTVTFPDVMNEQERLMIWHGAWLVGDDGHEGAWFYSARGGGTVHVAVPPEATGLRIRRWPNDGFDAEYADLAIPGGKLPLDVTTLDFDSEQAHSLLARRHR